ncbi:MAG: leucine-rich repeat domain-containing protein [Anaerolineae bacterium]|nr:leucine-rich repeat domain-containing protein [Anaerolineae bacterium]
MKRLFLLILTLLLTSGLIAAQVQSPYDIAFERIEAARISGATELDLSGLGLNTLPPEVFQLTDLTTLMLYNNQLTSLSPEISKLSGLTTLLLSRNQLTSLPPQIGQLTNLRSLDLSENQLAELPAEFFQLNNLNELYLSSNQLTYLPPEISQLSHLCYLIIIDNALHHLPTELAQLKILSVDSCRLDIDFNPLITPPPDVVAQGTPAIMDYLRNQAAMQAQQITLAIASMVGLVAAFLLAFRWRTRRVGRKKKQAI